MPDNDEMVYYRLTATARFMSGLEKTNTAIVLVSDDAIPVVAST
jgi:hypothetical protein